MLHYEFEMTKCSSHLQLITVHFQWWMHMKSCDEWEASSGLLRISLTEVFYCPFASWITSCLNWNERHVLILSPSISSLISAFTPPWHLCCRVSDFYSANARWKSWGQAGVSISHHSHASVWAGVWGAPGTFTQGEVIRRQKEILVWMLVREKKLRGTWWWMDGWMHV